MTGSGVRKVGMVGGLSLLLALAAACSGGSTRVQTSPTTTHASDRSSPTTTSRSKKRAANAKAAAKKAAATKAKTATKKSTSNGATPTTLGTLVVPVSGSNATVGNPAAAPGTQAAPAAPGGTTPPTSPRATPTTVKPFDPTKTVDLSGTPGVTPAEQARAEELVRDTLRDLPKYANPQTAYADGYRSINDGLTGSEHYVKWSLVDDGRILDSKYPESLVYQYRNGKKTLVSAMYMLPLGSRFSDVPDVGGPLTQWHIHDNLCLVDNPVDPLQKYVGGLTGSDGSCPSGTTKAPTTPMLHVWIVANPCGPFAALDGIEAGQIPDGETRLCDTAHGG